MLRAVLFDLDNTLFDRDVAFRRWAAHFVSAHFPNDPASQVAAIEALVDLDASGYRPREELFHMAKERWVFIEPATETLVASFYVDLQRYIALDQGAALLLDHLAACGIPFGIVTNGSASQMRKIQTLKLDALASCIFVSEVFGARKPDAPLFLAAADHLGVPPADILFVGDDPQADILGAHAVGMTTAWVERSRLWPQGLPRDAADLCITTLAELMAVVPGS